MAEDLDARALDREMDAFTGRISALRVARECAPEDALATLDAALVELERAAEELRVRGEELDQHGGNHTHGPSGHEQERRVLQSAFQELPFPALLLDHTGAVRRANRMMVDLLGTSSAYVTGQPFPSFVELTSRAAFDSQLAGVLRAGKTARFDSRLLCAGGSTDVRLAISRVQVPGWTHPLVSVVVAPGSAGGLRPAAFVSESEEEVVVEAARRLDIMARMTRLLLDEESLSEPVALQRAARLLASEFSEWAVIDVVRDGQMCRAVVAGHEDYDDGQGVRILEELDPSWAHLPRDVLDTGNPVVHTLIEDPDALGVADGGAPALTALRAGSLLCVPLRNQHESLGALTLVRRSDRRRFGLSDLGLVEEIADHLALAIRTERRYQRRSDAADALQASLLPRTVPTIPGLEVGVGYHPATEGVEVGGDFYDVFASKDGWGLVLGDVCGKGEDAAAVTAMVRHGVRLLGLWQTEPGDLLRQINHAMVVRQETDRFVTAVAAHLVPGECGVRVRLASAGHPRAVMVRAEGSVHFASGGGIPLGVFDNAAVATEDVHLAAGDTLLLYSDGVTEARRSDGSLYGDRGVADILARTRGLPAQALVKAIEDDLYLRGGGRTRDDVALLAVRVTQAA